MVETGLSGRFYQPYFLLLSYIPDGESIVIVQHFDFQILTEILVLSTPDSKKLFFKKCPAGRLTVSDRRIYQAELNNIWYVGLDWHSLGSFFELFL